MKKSVIYFGMAALSLLSVGAPTVTHAATVGTPSDTTGQVTLQAPATGAVTLDTTKLSDILNFGSSEIQYATAIDQIATADGDQSKEPTTTDLKVTDDRGNTAGWKLELEQAQQFTSTKKNTALTGAALKIDTSKVTNVGGTQPTGGQINKTGCELTPGIAVELLKANAGEGDGISTMTINKYDLNIPGKAPKESDTYTTTLTWTFSDTI
ncbi:WxL domain-containing protein [Enterococcus canintestini]|uniref:WxL domain-containing protein n=1 Tax=Enterococcus canintestini TaxID=317010 RepID=UPI000BA2851B|nr:WxL domain-containing protein [Enterococcus canintestini]